MKAYITCSRHNYDNDGLQYHLRFRAAPIDFTIILTESQVFSLIGLFFGNGQSVLEAEVLPSRENE